MASKKLRPASVGTHGQSLDSFGSRAASNGPQITQIAESLQRRRAAYLARRFRLPLTMAAAVASLYFVEARQ